MRCKKNIILTLKNITAYFTGKEKIITLVSIIIMLSFVNITFTSALSYQSSVGIGFTFNPTLSVSISPSDLIISNLVPGNTLDSNVINVSVASNASYGYTLSAIVNGNNDDLTHSNGTNTFSSIATDADLSDLEDSEDTNIWGYSTSLDSGATWSNYNGLSSNNSTTLLDANSNVSSNLDFKIAAKAASTQASGTYTGVINFTAVTKHIPITLAEAYASEGKTMINGFYTMQDMTSTICSKVEAMGAQLQVLDIRDNKLYWISKLADNHCWMTQNLNLDLDSNRTYTHWDTDLGWSTDNGNTINENATWKPLRSTINFTGTKVSEWVDSDTEPYSANPGDIYYYTSNSDANDIQYNSLQECINADHNDCAHYHAGNYYNWSAAVASNITSDIVSGNASNSICSTGWKLPNRSNNNFGNLLYLSGVNRTDGYSGYMENGFQSAKKMPLYLTRSGGIRNKSSMNFGARGYYWSSTTGATQAKYLNFNISMANTDTSSFRYDGFSVRCLAR